MARVFFKAVLRGAVSWLILIFLLFFGIGFYRGFLGQGAAVDLSANAIFILRYSILTISLAVAVGVFFYEKKYLPETPILSKEPPKFPQPQPSRPPVFSKPITPPITTPKVPETPLVFQPPKITEPPKAFLNPSPEPVRPFDFPKPPLRPPQAPVFAPPQPAPPRPQTPSPMPPPLQPQTPPKVFGTEPQPFWPKEPEKKEPQM